ncbi:S26 family signal peptidase [Streptomyces zhihengii]
MPRPEDPHRRRSGSSAAVTGALALAAAATITVGAYLTPERGLLYAILPLLLGVLLVARRLLARRIASVTVRGRSMEPSYHEGDRVLVRRIRTLRRDRSSWWSSRESTASGSAPLPAGADNARMSRRRWLIKRVEAVPGDPVPRAGFPSLSQAKEDAVPRARWCWSGTTSG